LLVSHPYVQSRGFADIAKPLLEEENSEKENNVTLPYNVLTKKSSNLPNQ
jgi:hypothetical protein